jgi:hypothetical protein
MALMGLLQALFWALGILGGAAALYGLHRLCLWLEQRGWLFYMDRKPTGSVASCFVAVQQAIEPAARHVHEMKETRRTPASDETPGECHP